MVCDFDRRREPFETPSKMIIIICSKLYLLKLKFSIYRFRIFFKEILWKRILNFFVEIKEIHSLSNTITINNCIRPYGFYLNTISITTYHTVVMIKQNWCNRLYDGTCKNNQKPYWKCSEISHAPHLPYIPHINKIHIRRYLHYTVKAIKFSKNMKYGRKDNGFIGRFASLNARVFDIYHLYAIICISSSQQCEIYLPYLRNIRG